MSWLYNSFNAWSPHWMFVEPYAGAKLIGITNQEQGDKYFYHLGYDTTGKPSNPGKDRNNLFRPSVATAAEVDADIARYQSSIRGSLVEVHKLLQGNEGLWIEALEYIQKLSKERGQDSTVFSKVIEDAWQIVAEKLETEKEEIPEGMAYDFHWLRDQFRVAPDGPERDHIPPNGPFPANSAGGYRDHFTERLTYRKLAFGKAAPNDAILLAPHINKTALYDAAVFAQFVFSRYLVDPSEFWRHDFNQTYIGRSTRSGSEKFLTRHVMSFNDNPLMTEDNVPTQYGNRNDLDPVSLASLATGEVLSVDEGLRLLRAQDFIYKFLLQSCILFEEAMEQSVFKGLRKMGIESTMTKAKITEHILEMSQRHHNEAICRAFANPLGDDQRSATWNKLKKAIKDTANQRKEVLVQLRRNPKAWWRRADMFEEQSFGHIGELNRPEKTLDKIIDPSDEGTKFGGFTVEDLQRLSRLQASRELVISSVERALYWEHLAEFCGDFESKTIDGGIPWEEHDWEQLYIRTRLVLLEALKDFRHFRFQGSKAFRDFFVRSTTLNPRLAKYQDLVDPKSTKTKVVLNSVDIDAKTKELEGAGRRTGVNKDDRPPMTEWEWKRNLARLIYLITDPISLEHVGMRAVADALEDFFQNEHFDCCLLDNQQGLLAELQLLSRTLVFLEEMKAWPFITHQQKERWDATICETKETAPDGNNPHGRHPFGKLRKALTAVRAKVRVVTPGNPGPFDVGVAGWYRDYNTKDVINVSHYFPMGDPAKVVKNKVEPAVAPGGDPDIEMKDVEDEEDDEDEEPRYAWHFAKDTHDLVVKLEDALRKSWREADYIIRGVLDDDKKRKDERKMLHYFPRDAVPDKASSPYANLMYRVDTMIEETQPWTNPDWAKTYKAAWQDLHEDEEKAPPHVLRPSWHPGSQTLPKKREGVQPRAIRLDKKGYKVANIIWNIDGLRDPGTTFKWAAFKYFMNQIGAFVVNTDGSAVTFQMTENHPLFPNFNRKLGNFHPEHGANAWVPVRKYGHWADEMLADMGVTEAWLVEAEPGEKFGYLEVPRLAGR